jgi:hypothetical protein
MAATTTTAKEGVATEALEIQKQITELTKKLDGIKDDLRGIANGNTLEVVIPGLGKVNVSTPREGSETSVLVFDEDKLAVVPELKQKLLDKGIARMEVKKVAPAKASVTIKPNV